MVPLHVQLFERSIGQHDLPEKITIDKSGANTAAVRGLIADSGVTIELRQSKYLNNRRRQRPRGPPRCHRVAPCRAGRTQMTAAIRVLHLEDDPADAQRIRDQLQDESLACDIAWVQASEDFISALQRQAFDLVLCDYEFGGLELLRQVKEQSQELPLIVISAGMTEEQAVDCMKAGATNYVLKQRLRRLGFSVRRALAEQRQRAALRRAEEDLRALNAALETRVTPRTAELETANSFLSSVIEHIP